MPPKSHKSYNFGKKETFLMKREGVVDYETLGLKADIADLKQQLINAELRLFNAKKEALRIRRYPDNKLKKLPKTYVHSVGIKDTIEEADRIRLETNLELYEGVTGVKVSFTDDSRYCVMYEICLDGVVVGKHAIEILKDEPSKLGKCSMPLGFQYKAIAKNYRDIRVEGFVLEIHEALVAYYSRLRQIENLKKITSNDQNVFYTIDGTTVELSFPVGHTVLNWIVNVCVRFTYTLTVDRPNSFELFAQGLEPEFVTTLEDHLEKFVQFPLDEAFTRFKNDFSVENGDFAIILKKKIFSVQDRPVGSKRKKVKQSRIQNSKEYLSDAELHLLDDTEHKASSNLHMNSLLQIAMDKANIRRPAKSAAHRQQEPIARAVQIELQKNIPKERSNGQVQHLSLYASKYIPSESGSSSEDEKPVKKLKTPVQMHAVLSANRGRSKQNSQIQSSTSTPCAHLPEHRLHRRLLINKTLKNNESNLDAEKAEEDELDRKAIKKVKEWLRTTPLPEEMQHT